MLLWDYERGSLPYDALCALMALFLWLVSGAALGDPMKGMAGSGILRDVGEAR